MESKKIVSLLGPRRAGKTIEVMPVLGMDDGKSISAIGVTGLPTWDPASNLTKTPGPRDKASTHCGRGSGDDSQESAAGSRSAVGDPLLDVLLVF